MELPRFGRPRAADAAQVEALCLAQGVPADRLVDFEDTDGVHYGVVGGNPEAARQAGMRVGLLLLSAMLVGGALAGLGGFTQLAGVEYKLRPNFLVTYGYIGFLAAWLGGHRPLGIVLACLLFGAISVGGDSHRAGWRQPF